jgi:hypothetical protein
MLIDRAALTPLKRQAIEDPLLLEKTKGVRRKGETLFALGARVGISPTQILFWEIPRIEKFCADQEKQAADREKEPRFPRR